VFLTHAFGLSIDELEQTGKTATEFEAKAAAVTDIEDAVGFAAKVLRIPKPRVTYLETDCFSHGPSSQPHNLEGRREADKPSAEKKEHDALPRGAGHEHVRIHDWMGGAADLCLPMKLPTA
jgi:hypothetical protein